MLVLNVTTVSYASETPLSVAQPASSVQSKPPIVIEGYDYNRLRNLYREGQHEDAIAQALLYLNEHPMDGDVRFLLGTFYFYSKDYLNARIELSNVLQQYPQYFDARPVLVNVDIALGHYQEANDITDVGLILNPENVELLSKKKELTMSIPMKTTSQATSNQPISSVVTIHKSTIKTRLNTTASLPRVAEKKKYLNEVGIYQQNYYISDVHQTWDYSTVYYGRDTGFGKVYGKLNYSNRQFMQAPQGEIEAYPKLSKYVYLYLDFAFANNPSLFPDRKYGVEGYLQAGKTLSLSLGGKYNNIDSHHHFTVLTGSIAKDNKQDRLTFRPYYFIPGIGNNSTLYTLDFRHTINDPFYYFGCLIGAGTSPDLADLITINFIILKNKMVNPYINFPLFNDQLIVNLGVLYQNQIFPTNRVRNWIGGTMGLVWKY